jgi:hypothetical protein
MTLHNRPELTVSATNRDDRFTQISGHSHFREAALANPMGCASARSRDGDEAAYAHIKGSFQLLFKSQNIT